MLPAPRQRLPHSPWGDHTEAGISLQPMKRTTPDQISTPWPMEHPTDTSRWILPEGLQPRQEPTVEPGKSMKRKEQKRGIVRD